MLIIYMALVWDFSFMREVRNRCSTINLPLQNVPDHLLRCTRTLAELGFSICSTSSSAPSATSFQSVTQQQSSDPKRSQMELIRTDGCRAADPRAEQLGCPIPVLCAGQLGCPIPALWARSFRGARTLPSAGVGQQEPPSLLLLCGRNGESASVGANSPLVFLFWNGCTLGVVFIYIYVVVIYIYIIYIYFNVAILTLI